MIPPDLTNPITGEYTIPWHPVFQAYEPERLEAFRAWRKQHTAFQELDAKTVELIIVAIDSVVAWPSPFIDAHIHAGFDQGATIAEMTEAIFVSLPYGGGHALNSGLTAMGKTIRERRAAGQAPPRNGAGNGKAVAAAEPPLLPWHKLLQKYDPARFEGLRNWERVYQANRELTRKAADLIMVAIDSLISRPQASITAHIGAAFDSGATVQEVLEAILVAAHFGDHPLENGLTAMDAVIQARTAAGNPPPRTKAAVKAR